MNEQEAPIYIKNVSVLVQDESRFSIEAVPRGLITKVLHNSQMPSQTIL